MNSAHQATKADNFKNSRNADANEYREIESHSLPKPTGNINVLYSRVPGIAAAIFYIMFGGLALLLLVNSGFDKPAFFMVVANALILAFVVFIRAKAKSKSVKSFDAEGALACNGQKLLWTDFRGRVVRTGRRYGRSYIWRTELIFTANRQLWILPQRIKNYKEVSLFVNKLPLAILKAV